MGDFSITGIKFQLGKIKRVVVMVAQQCERIECQ